MTLENSSPAGRLRAAVAAASTGLVERAWMVELVALAAVAREHVLIAGPPGTAKSEAVRRLARVIDGRWFEYLLGRFTEPSEIFGPVDLKRLREGEVETRTAGMLPEAEIAFLDEVFLGSTAILNTLLGVLMERRYRRGHTSLRCPLRVCVGATNELPDDPALAAFADRFLVHAFVEPLGDSRVEELLDAGWTLDHETLAPLATIADVDALAERARAVTMAPLVPALAHAVRLLKKTGVALSDRRIVKLQRLVAAAAALDGRDVATEADLWPTVYVVPTQVGQDAARDALRDLLAPATNALLNAAAEEASAGPAARAARLTAEGDALLGRRPQDADATARERWELRLEGILRQIDAGFAADERPPTLDAVRERLVAAVAAGTA